ncbi:hypothetical protein DFP72DRAFT_1115248 [Ephemerocybe angulata]|uniref:Nephrocystin 3-like N-terminal domain-containing protein n=1 Tax=Ephemerocybe angulata TaxID=980116 RepID=A0A8H6H6M7_9AGAR|nr:hypothetical protein DFP72DRAFT_1115248 [Tulosesus angulatus]
MAFLSRLFGDCLRDRRRQLEDEDGPADPRNSEFLAELAAHSSYAPQRDTIPSNTTAPTPLPNDHSLLPSSLASTSFFSQAQNVNLGYLTYNEAPSGRASRRGAWEPGWKDLLMHTAANALYNSDARFDPPKCDEDTRIEVIGQIMDWIAARDSPTRMLCMTGAAGAGKSALQQTIAERCEKAGILASTFFFWKGDATRNTGAALVSTIAYQLGMKTPALRPHFGRAVNGDPLIFKKSLFTQFNSLIMDPLEEFRSAKGDQALHALPYVILIDGLDECEDATRQAEILTVLKATLLGGSQLPFRIFIASRPEWPIRSALEAKGSLCGLAHQIRLSDDYDATADIRKVLWRRLRAIGSLSSDPRALPHLWPTNEDVELLVEAASGQFIYIATVVKYVSERRSSPVDRLRVVLTWRPTEGQRTAPFAALDTLYSNILSAAKAEYEKVDTNEHEFLLLFMSYPASSLAGSSYAFSSVERTDAVLGLPLDTWKLVISDLFSVATHQDDVSSGHTRLHFYHKSFQDFLYSKLRAKDLYVSEERIASFLLQPTLRDILKSTQPYLLQGVERFALLISHGWPDFTFPQDTALELLYPAITEFTQSGGWEKVKACFTTHKHERYHFLSEGIALYMLRAVGIIVFDTVFPSMAELGSVDLQVASAIQTWQYETLSQIFKKHRVKIKNEIHSTYLRLSELQLPNSQFEADWWALWREESKALKSLFEFVTSGGKFYYSKGGSNV